MNLIEKLNFDIAQSAEYGGMPNYYSRSELRKIVKALEVGEMLVDHIKVFDLNPTIENLDELDKIIQVWNDSINS